MDATEAARNPRNVVAADAEKVALTTIVAASAIFALVNIVAPPDWLGCGSSLL